MSIFYLFYGGMAVKFAFLLILQILNAVNLQDTIFVNFFYKPMCLLQGCVEGGVDYYGGDLPIETVRIVNSSGAKFTKLNFLCILRMGSIS
jgi:hypothetical protein